MKNAFKESLDLPEGVHAHVDGNTLTCTKSGASVKKNIPLPGFSSMKVSDGKITIECAQANKRDIAVVRSAFAHMKNMFAGLNEHFVYEMEICNVHFPMTVKVEGHQFVVTNFLGEKEKRIARIAPGVKVEVKGVKVIVSSSDMESAGQTAANIEKATNVAKRDRRVFQDGIFITSKCGVPI